MPALAVPQAAMAATPVFINEIHYDNTGTDTGEAIEIAGPAGTDLTGWSLVRYNGNGGAEYGTDALAGTIPDLGGGYGVVDVTYPTNGLQNGAPDGVALVDAGSNVVQFLSYEGSFTASDGPANGMASTDIGVSESSGTAVGDSLQLAGSGTVYEDFTWAGPVLSSFGSFNTGQTFGNGGGGPSDPVINEFVFNHTGSDTQAFIEVFGDPESDYAGFTVLEIEGDSSGAGTIDAVLPLGTTNSGGFWTNDEDAENGTVTLLLVEGFTGSSGSDLDTDNDGVLDSTPWTRIVDDVAVSDNDSSDRTYAGTVLDSGFDGGSFTVGGASRIPNGTDTDAAGDWVRNDFDGFGFPGFIGSPALGEAVNTPGLVNEVITVPTDPIGVCGDPATLIHAIQGSGLVSGDVGSIREVEAVVTATFQDPNQIGGYFVQEEDGDVDADSLTSEGLRIFDPANTPNVGDVVRIRGSVAEFFGLTELTNVTGFAVCGSGVATPATVTLPVTSVDDFEKYEGMAVTIPQTLYISEFFNFDRFGEIVLTTERQFQPTASFEPGSPEAAQLALDNSLSRITLDDGRGNQNPDPAIHPNGSVFDLTNLFRGGDTVANVTGVMDYNFGFYKIQPTQGADYTSMNPRTDLPDDVGGNLKVASFNVLNYFTTIDDSGPICGPLQNQGCRGADTAEEFIRQRDKIIAALSAIDADVVGLIEIENHPGDVPTADLVSSLNAVMGAGTYEYIATGAVGSDAIRQAFIYKPATVSPIGEYALLDATVDSRFNDDKNRPVLAQTFLDNASGGVFTVAVNHLKSKGSPCDDVGDPDTGDGSGNCNLTRKAAAEALVDWLASDPTGSSDGDFMIIGDLNSYDKEDPIDVLLAGGYADLLFNYGGESAYSYVFDGQLGYLDYGMANQDLLPEVTSATAWHINSDEPDIIDYDMTFKQDAQDALYEPNAYRASDHDPVIVGLELTTEAEIIELINEVQKLLDDGVLNYGQANALISKLENVLAKLANGNPKAAANQLGAYINQVEDFVNEDILTAEQGMQLIKPAALLVEVLSDQ
jgi:predicted extracellular nuclease